MSKATIWVITGIALFLIGSIIFLSVMSVNNWDFSKLSTKNYETTTHTIKESFENIDIQTPTADITLMPSADGTCQVICFEADDKKHSVTVKEGVLMVTQSEEAKKWYRQIGINTKTPKITVYLPQDAYTSLLIDATTGDTNISHPFQFQNVDISCTTGDIECRASASAPMKLRTTTGDIDAAHLCVGELDISVTTGEIALSDIVCQGDIRTVFGTGDADFSDISCQTLTAKGNTGDFVMENVIASGKVSVTTNTGDISFQRCDASEIFMKANTGYIKGSLLSEKIFSAKTTTGSIRVPSSTSGGKCELSTNTGDIRITVVSE